MSNRTSKLKHELLVPGEQGWELWQGAPNTALTKTRDFEGLPGAFATAAARRTLALPAASLWVLPAWLKGDEATLRDIAQLHLERLRVRTPEHAQALQVESLRADDDSHLASIVALKDIPTPLTDFRLLPDECRMSASCFKLPPDAIILWRELGKLVIAITVGSRLAYFSPMSAASLDHQGIAELNNICLQLTFQKVLTQLNGILLWTEEGDLNRIQSTTGLTVARHDRPEPQMLGTGSTLMPADVIQTRQQKASSTRARTGLLAAGFAIAACVAIFSFVLANATRERDALREKIAELQPRATKSETHKAQWNEVAAAVDTSRWPMELLLRCMEPESVKDVALTSFECTSEKIVIQGRTPEITPALKFTEDIKQSEQLVAFQWDSPTPTINSTDNSAAFELRGTLPTTEVTP